MGVCIAKGQIAAGVRHLFAKFSADGRLEQCIGKRMTGQGLRGRDPLQGACKSGIAQATLGFTTDALEHIVVVGRNLDLLKGVAHKRSHNCVMSGGVSG